MTKKRAVCLLSGGLDSATALYVAIHEGYVVSALSFRYGQKHEREIESASALCVEKGIEHVILPVHLPWGGSALLDSSAAVPVARSLEEIGAGIPSTYVPARNTIFLSFAASFAETRDAETVFIGANALDYSGYPDCRHEYLRAMERALLFGTRRGVQGESLRIEAPLLRLSKKGIVQLGAALGVPFEKTWSCYQGGEYPCGICDSCLLRRKGFVAAGVKDPLENYALSADIG